MDKVKVGIIGIGNMGTSHCNTLLKGEVPEMELVAVADIREQRRKWAKENLPQNIKIFNDDKSLIESGICDAPGTNRFEIDLTKGKLVCEDNKLTCYECEDEREFMFSSKEGFAKPKGKYIDIELVGENPQHAGIMRTFAASILHGTPLIAKGQEGINGLRLSNAIHLSSWLNREVEIPFDQELFYEELSKKRASSRRKDNIKEVTFSTEGTY